MFYITLPLAFVKNIKHILYRFLHFDCIKVVEYKLREARLNHVTGNISEHCKEIINKTNMAFLFEIVNIQHYVEPTMSLVGDSILLT